MALGDVVIVVPPAILLVTGQEPLIDPDQSGQYGAFTPPNFKDGDTVALDLSRIRTKNASFLYGGVEQTITGRERYKLTFTADTTGLGDLGTDQAAIVTDEVAIAAVNHYDNVLLHLNGYFLGNNDIYSNHAVATAGPYSTPTGGAGPNALAEWNSTRQWLGVDTCQIIPDYASTFDKNMSKFNLGEANAAQNFLDTDWTCSLMAYVETTDLSEVAATPKTFVAGFGGGAINSNTFVFGYRHTTSQLYLYHHWGAGVNDYDEYFSLMTFTKGAFKHFHMSHKLDGNIIYWGTDGNQESFGLVHTTIGSTINSGMSFGGAQPYNTQDDLNTSMTGSFTDVIITDTLLFGEEATYTVPTAYLPTGAWSVGPQHPDVEAGGGLWGTRDAAFQACGFTYVDIQTTGKSYDWSGTAWAFNSNTPVNHANRPGFAGGLNESLIFGGNTASNTTAKTAGTDSFDGTSWTAESNLPAARDNCAGFGTFLDAVCAGGNNGVASTVNWSGTSWAGGANMTSAEYRLTGTGRSHDGLVVGGSFCNSFDGTAYTSEAAPTSAGLGNTFAGTSTNGVLLGQNSGASTYRRVPEHWNGAVWVNMDEVSVQAQNGVGTGTGRWGELMFAAVNGDPTSGNALFYDGDIAETHDLIQDWP